MLLPAPSLDQVWRHRIVAIELAQRWYTQRVQYRVFSKWQRNWQVVRKRVAMLHRALSHHSSRLLSLRFYSWRMTLALKRQGIQAGLFARIRILRSLFQRWRRVMRLRAHDACLTAIARVHALKSRVCPLLRRWHAVTKFARGLRHYQTSLGEAVAYFSRLRLTRSHWLRWLTCFRRHCTAAYQLDQQIIQFRRRNRLQRGFLHLQRIVLQSRDRSRLHDESARLYRRSALLRAVYALQQAVAFRHTIEYVTICRRSRLVAQTWRGWRQLFSATVLHRRASLLTYLRRWLGALGTHRLNLAHEHLADQSYAKHVQITVFRAWARLVSHQKHGAQLLVRVFKHALWTEHLEALSHWRHLTLARRRSRSLRRLASNFPVWYHFRSWRRALAAQRQLFLAQNHYFANTQRRCLIYWRASALLSEIRGRQFETHVIPAVRRWFRRSHLHRVIALWRRRTKTHRALRQSVHTILFPRVHLMFRQWWQLLSAVKQHRILLLRRHFALWARDWRLLAIERVVVYSDLTNRMTGAFRHWRRAHSAWLARCTQGSHLRGRRLLRLLSLYVLHWQQMTSRHHKLAVFSEQCRLRLIQPAFQRWQVHFNDARGFRILSDHFLEKLGEAQRSPLTITYPAQSSNMVHFLSLTMFKLMDGDGAASEYQLAGPLMSRAWQLARECRHPRLMACATLYRWKVGRLCDMFQHWKQFALSKRLDKIANVYLLSRQRQRHLAMVLRRWTHWVRLQKSCHTVAVQYRLRVLQSNFKTWRTRHVVSQHQRKSQAMAEQINIVWTQQRLFRTWIDHWRERQATWLSWHSRQSRLRVIRVFAVWRRMYQTRLFRAGAVIAFRYHKLLKLCAAALHRWRKLVVHLRALAQVFLQRKHFVTQHRIFHALRALFWQLRGLDRLDCTLRTVIRRQRHIILRQPFRDWRAWTQRECALSIVVVHYNHGARFRQLANIFALWRRISYTRLLGRQFWYVLTLRRFFSHWYRSFCRLRALRTASERLIGTRMSRMSVITTATTTTTTSGVAQPYRMDAESTATIAHDAPSPIQTATLATFEASQFQEDGTLVTATGDESFCDNAFVEALTRRVETFHQVRGRLRVCFSRRGTCLLLQKSPRMFARVLVTQKFHLRNAWVHWRLVWVASCVFDAAIRTQRLRRALAMWRYVLSKLVRSGQIPML